MLLTLIITDRTMARNFEVMSVKLNAVRMYCKLHTPQYTLQSLTASGYKIKQGMEQWQLVCSTKFAWPRYTNHSISSLHTASRFLRKVSSIASLHVFPSYNAEEFCTATFVNVGISAAVRRRREQCMNTDTGLWDIQIYPIIQLL
jgi:hypothetical protein